MSFVALSDAALGQAIEEEDLALVYGDKATVSIATGTKQLLRRAPAVATVITAEDIAAMGATNMDEVLETVAGLHVSSAGTRNFTIYQMRGIFGNPTNPQVLLLLNGTPLNTLYRGDKGEVWGDQPLENVARIEIIRGPGSALYGADAYAGVINVITRSPGEIRGTEVGARAGAFGRWDAWLQHGGKLGAVAAAAYLRVGRTDGYEGTVTRDAQTSRDLVRGTRASLAPGEVNTGFNAIDASADFAYEKWRLRAGYKLRDDLGTGTGVSSALDPIGKNKGERFNADLSWIDGGFAQDWEVGFAGSFSDYQESEYLVLSPPGSQFTASPTTLFPEGMIGNPGRKERQVRLSGYTVYSGFADHRIRLGIGHDDLNLYAASTIKNYLLNAAGVPVHSALLDYYSLQPHVLPHRRLVDYVYAQDEWHFARDWTLTAGLRRDLYSDAGGTTNPRLALVWDARIDLTAKLLYGEAFRAPAFAEQYGVNPVSNGNPSLKPETTRSLEAALSWQATRDLEVNLSVYRHRLDDIIAVSGGIFANTGSQHGRGTELEAVWNASRTVRLTANASYQVSTDDVTGQDIGYAPRHHLYARADWQLGGWLASAQVNRVEDRKRARGDTRPKVPDYTAVDVTLRTNRPSYAWNFAASVRNLFNATVLEPSYYDPIRSQVLLPDDIPMPRRSFYVQATYAL